MVISEPLKKGQVLEGYVKSITDFGVFVDLGGIDGLLHVSQISHKRISHPLQVFAIGDRIRVIVLKYDRSQKKVSLGMKQLASEQNLKVSKASIYKLKKQSEREINRQKNRKRLDTKTDLFDRARGKAISPKIIPGGLPSLGKKK